MVLLFHFFLARFIAVMPTVSICLVYDSSLLLCLLCLFVLFMTVALWPPVLQFKLPTFLFVCVIFVLFLLFS